MVGTIRVIIGCMYSGKTSYLMKEYKRWTSIGKKVICINYINDIRYENDGKLYTHDLNKMECLRCKNLIELEEEELNKAEVILINEGQFFKDLINFCIKWCEEKNKDIVVSGLDGTFLRKPFGQILDLIPLAESVEKIDALCSICKNGTEAFFSLRLTNEIDEIVIGSDNYIPVCRKHFLELSNKKKNILE